MSLPIQRRSIPTKLTPYQDQLNQALIADSYRPKRDRRSALKLLEELQQAGYDGGYTQLTDYIRAWRKAGVGDAGKQAFVPLKFQWGEAFQFDWSEGHWSSAAFVGACKSLMSNSAPAGLFCWRPILAKAMKCCSMPIAARSERSAVCHYAGYSNRFTTNASWNLTNVEFIFNFLFVV